MHISEVEKMRMEKEHQMRNGYQRMENRQFPHDKQDMESTYVFKDTENKHAVEQIPQNNYGPGAP